MTIRLTPKQYKTLAKMAWLSERLAIGSEIQDSETIAQILSLAKTIYEKAPDFDAMDIFPVPRQDQTRSLKLEKPGANADAPQSETAEKETDGDPDSEGMRLKEDIETELFSILEWYEEYSFWDLLEDRLTMRDVADDRTEAQWNWLPDVEKDRIYYKHLDYYYDEFAENGILNLRFVAPDPDKPKVTFGWSEGGDANSGQKESGDADRPAARGRSGKIIEFPGSTKAPPKKPRE